MKNILLIIVLLLSMVGQASAMKISEYRARKDHPQQKVQIELYLKGYIHGIFNANDILEARGDQPLFCMPDQDRFLRKGNYTDFLDSILNRTSTYVKDDTTIEIAILSTFVNTYPCKGSTSVKSKK